MQLAGIVATGLHLIVINAGTLQVLSKVSQHKQLHNKLVSISLINRSYSQIESLYFERLNVRCKTFPASRLVYLKPNIKQPITCIKHLPKNCYDFDGGSREMHEMLSNATCPVQCCLAP